MVACPSATRARGNHEWSLPEADSREIIKQALDAGINFFDPANVYSACSSEEIVGRALAEIADRDETVLATKVLGKMRPGPNGGGLSRKATLSEIDHSLASAPTTSTSTRSTVGTTRRRLRSWTRSSARAKPATSAPRG